MIDRKGHTEVHAVRARTVGRPRKTRDVAAYLIEKERISARLQDFPLMLRIPWLNHFFGYDSRSDAYNEVSAFCAVDRRMLQK
jgi:hypothetical protein